MRTCKIFLASSAELDTDKEKFEIYISNKNKSYKDKGVFFELVTWKDFVSAMTEVHSQEQYNEYIRTCDISIFLFHTKLGKFTKEEFEIAHDSFQKSNNRVKKPLIYTYFKNDDNESDQISEFRSYVDNLNHFYDTYNDLNELFVKFNKQIEILEKEGKVVLPEKIDVKKLNKYAVLISLPIVILISVFLALYYYQPTDMTVKISEKSPIPNLPIKQCTLTLIYGDKVEKLVIEKDEAVFKQIPSKYKREKLHLLFESTGYLPIDTTVRLDEYIELKINRDNSLGEIVGMVKDENNHPLDGVEIAVKDIKTISDNSGMFKIIIPREKQQLEQRVTAFRKDFKLWDYAFPVVANQDIMVILIRE